jgi:hypothetical protein
MPNGKLVFTKIVQDSQDYGSNDEHMVSRVFFDIVVGEEILRGLYADVKQTIGARFESAPLEVSLPESLQGRIDYSSFRQHVEDYYRDSIGARGRGIHIGGGANIRMMNNTFIIQKTIDIDVNDRTDGSGW